MSVIWWLSDTSDIAYFASRIYTKDFTVLIECHDLSIASPNVFEPCHSLNFFVQVSIMFC